MQKKRRRLLPFTPVEDPSQRMKEMGSLASALTALNMEFSDDLTYLPGWAPRSANEAKLEKGGMQVWIIYFDFDIIRTLNQQFFSCFLKCFSFLPGSS